MTGLEVLAATVCIKGKMLIDGVTFTAAPGQVTGLIGPNGAGKSTLMRAVLALQVMTSGTIRFAGADISLMPRRERAKFSAFVEQSAATDTHLSGRDVVMLGRIPFQSVWQSTPSHEDEHVVTSALEAVSMGDFGARAYETLSGGEQQRLQIARALAQEPRLLLLDEPTNHLDVNAQLTTLSLMRERAKFGSTILLALHDLNLAATYCDSLIILHRGKVAACGAPDEVLTPALLREVYQVNADVLGHPRTGRPILAYHSPL